MRLFLGAVSAVVLSACGSLKKDMQTMCDAPSKVELSKYDPADQGTILAGWIDEHLSSSEGKKFFSSLASIDPRERTRLIREAAKEQGLTTCAWADFYEAAMKAKPVEPTPAQ